MGPSDAQQPLYRNQGHTEVDRSALVESDKAQGFMVRALLKINFRYILDAYAFIGCGLATAKTLVEKLLKSA